MTAALPKDARTIAQDLSEYYRKEAHNAKLCNDISAILLLLVTAATTLVAAFKVISWVTAVLAAISFFLVGLRSQFNFKETWVRSGIASVRVLNLLDSYDVLPQEGKDQEAKDSLIAECNAIREQTIKGWEAYERRPAASMDLNQRPVHPEAN
jgi:hypothetical protein